MKFLLFRINIFTRLMNIIAHRKEKLIGKYIDQTVLARKGETK
jgi:hypothetical protein